MQLRLVVYPIIHKGFIHPSGCLGFLPLVMCPRFDQASNLQAQSSWLLSLGSPKVSNSEIVKGLSLVGSPHQAATFSLLPFFSHKHGSGSFTPKGSPKQISMIWVFHQPTSLTLQKTYHKLASSNPLYETFGCFFFNQTWMFRFSIVL